MATVVDNLSQSVLRTRCRLSVLNTGKTTPAGRSLFAGIRAQARLLGRLVRAVLGSRAQIVHIHTCSGFTFWRDALHAAAARILGGRVVWHIHGGYFREFCGSMGPVRQGLLRFLLGLGAAVVVLSDAWRERLRPLLPRGPWYVVPNGVPVPLLPSRQARRTARFLFMGNLGKAKGTEDLVRACGIAMKQGFDGAVEVAGPETAPGQKQALLDLTAAVGCEPVVRLAGTVTGRAKDEALKAADVFVLPSHAEGLPMAVLEGMAYGLPVLATRVGAIPEVVTDGVEGFLIQPGDVEALADRMLRLARDLDLRRRMGRAARRRVEAKFSLDRMAERILALYDKMLDRGGRHQ
jgi:glycosyltransferase involved in cell wall biosynthesis